MEAEKLGSGTVEGMAVHAAVEVLAANQTDLVERRKVPFVNADVGEGLVARCDEPVGDAVVDGVFADIDIERLEPHPFPVELSARRDLYRPTPGGGQQLVPGLDREIGALAGRLDGHSARTFRDGKHLLGPVDVKVEGRDGGGDGYADVIGIDVRLPAGRREAVGMAGARQDGEQQRQGEEETLFHTPSR